MVLKNSLKISYKGLTKNIICDSNLRYEDIVSKIIGAFELTDIHRSAIQIYDEHGSKYDKEIFEYFILLFPNPQKLFFIRLDTSKLIVNMPGQNDNKEPTTRYPFGISKTTNKLKNTDNTNTNEAVPVRRQNCFLGQWPGNAASELSNSEHSSEVRRRYQQDLVRGMVKKIKMFQDNNLKRKHIANPAIVKRSMRL